MLAIAIPNIEVGKIRIDSRLDLKHGGCWFDAKPSLQLQAQ